MTDDNVQQDSRATTDETSTSLLVRVKARDQEAWRQLWHLYEPLVVQWCRRLGVSETDRVDVTQEVFLTVVASIDRFQHDRQGDTFRGWLRTITKSRVADLRRKSATDTQGVGGSADQDAIQAVEDTFANLEDSDEDDRRHVVRRALEMILRNCEESTRKAFLRVVIGEEHPADVAQDLGLTPNAIYVAKARILRNFRREFADLVET